MYMLNGLFGDGFYLLTFYLLTKAKSWLNAG